MAHKKMSYKLDNILHGELGTSFDEGIIWEKLSERLDPQTKMTHRWTLAAGLFLTILLLPSSFKNEQLSHAEIALEEVLDTSFLDQAINNEVAHEPGIQSMEMLRLQRKSYAPISEEIRPPEIKGLEKIAHHFALHVQEEHAKVDYMLDNLSLIQASLEESSVNDQRVKKKKMTVRAQLQSSTPFKGDPANQLLEISLTKGSPKEKN